MAMSEEIILQGLGLLASILYLVVGSVIGRRKVSADFRLAHGSFITWWVGLGIIGLAGLWFAYVPIGSFGLAGARVTLYIFIFILNTALAGLSFYLLFVYTGDARHSRWAVRIFYIALTVALIGFIESQGPYIDDAGGLAYRHERPPGDWVGALVGLALVVPPLAAAVAYLALYRKAQTPTQKYRIVMVSAGFVLWFGFSAAGTLVRTAEAAAEAGFVSQLVSRLLGVLAASLVLMAYVPPRWVKRRGIVGLLDIARLRRVGDDAPGSDAGPFRG